MKLTRIVSKVAEGGILSTVKLKSTNLRLLRLFNSHRPLLTKELQLQGIQILDDLEPIHTEEELRLYLQYYFGSKVNVSELLRDHPRIYKRVAKIGAHEQIITSWGFEVVYNGRYTDAQLDKELAEAAVNGTVRRLRRELYNAIRYRASKQGVTLQAWIKAKGYTYSPDLADIKAKVVPLRDSGLSFSKIADELGISSSAAHKFYHQQKDN
ncbi:hypothetical protein [Paenibacillus xylanexedens]|uniref:hypothetical protein n=1 Tax=Paenibacillus xylanexedens TaxID=528191 RepID=UPI0011A1848B|nr:hypothetical protein [Paenibacillus xylanexedens]